MSLHYLDPDRELRECLSCMGEKIDSRCSCCRCETCNGTGRLGVEGAAPDVEIVHSPPSWGSQGFYYREVGDACVGSDGWPSGPFLTESAALAAARKEHKS